ncbi:MAG TPA: phosphomannomutase/phosphoglucomutase [Gemmatimonadaceae bacterium]|nr:phosphomannomutase/phosphoglucomutase [Gemmatimonadaceae bacterium]
MFRQYDIRGVVGTDLTVEAAEAIGSAYGALLAEQGLPREVAVGRDNRPSGEELHDALVRGLRLTGTNVVDIGVVPTPLLYWALHQLRVSGGIQITGSHNPPEFNGFKICVGTDSLHGAGIQRLRELAEAGTFPSGEGTLAREAVIDRYVDDVAERIGKLSRPLTVVMDCGNGVGALLAPALFPRIGLNPILLFAESDGTFPNHHPDPTVVENLKDLIATVVREKADIGIGFDGDADRIGIVDRHGAIIWGDHLLILYARDVLTRTGEGQPIIFDVKCSQALPDAISAAGGIPVMWKTGHSLIKEKMKELSAPLAGEMSGHMFFAEGFYGHDDALYGAARLLRIVADSGRGVDELLADIPKYVSTPEIRVDCEDDRKFLIVATAQRHFRATHDVIEVDGVRILYGDGWGLIRASNTQPILVVRFEATSERRLGEIREEVASWLERQGLQFPRE